MILTKENIKEIVSIQLPSSKSISNRVLIINALSGNSELPLNVSDCDDTNVMIQWLASKPHTVDIGAAGTAMRFSTALLAVSEGEHIITGSPRMKQRPVAVLVDALRSIGADISYMENEGFPPLKIQGNPALRGGEITLRGDVSSQYISALLMIGPYLQNGLKLNLTGDIISQAYIDMTIDLMTEFGADVEWADDSSIIVKPGRYDKQRYIVEADWSASSYWYEIIALSDECTSVFLPNLSPYSLQGDSAVADIFELLGVNTDFLIDEEDNSCVRLSKTGNVVKTFEYDFSNQPDLAQTLAVTCCMMDIPFHLTGLSTLRIKETDRLNALKAELAKLGFDIQVLNDSELLWDGKRRKLSDEQLRAIAIDTYDDHRMAMAFAPAALKNGAIIINHPEVVSKSYPNFWNDMQFAGFSIS
ncbi:MAG: 3-phosphoshikimate 1-carboxyvinyltransferase [Bacteroidaceae bacterium]|nr:3-phosphoshikimate 1-carboxyvinyltransferase [Bacteroidaceae bacterium]